MIGTVGHCLMDGVYHNLKGQGYPQKPEGRWEKSDCRTNPNAAWREGATLCVDSRHGFWLR